jgi:uncharacterized protein (DUF1697 family)
METYISMLRGINVSGHKKILMSDLKALYEELKFKDVVTYVQSGNVVFKSEKQPATDLSKKIRKKILEKYSFDVPVIIRNSSEIEKVVSKNPFLKEKGIDPEKLHVTFLSEAPNKLNLEVLRKVDHTPDKFLIIEK